MAFLHANSCECMKSELDLFTLPPTQTSLEGSQFIHYKPVSSLSDDGPIEFTIPGCDDYLDLAHTMLSLRVAITAPEGTAVEEFARVGPVNNFLHSMFNQIDVYFNQKLVSPPNNAYPYRAYIETLLNYSNSAINSHLGNALYYPDIPGKFELAPNAANGNLGLTNRCYYTQNKNTVDLVGHLHCDVFNQNKFLLNGVEVRVRLVRGKDVFCLMSAAADDLFSVKIKEASLIVRRVRVSPSILLAHANALTKATAKYPINRVEIKSFSLHSGIHGEVLDNIILGQVPKRIIVGFVDNKAFNGDKSLNPFNFQHFNINYFSLYVDGIQVPSKPLQPKFTGTNPQFVEAYNTLFSGTGIFFLNEGIHMSRSDYSQGYTLFAFDLTPDLSANSLSHWNLVKHGSVRLEVKFEQALAKTVTCIVYAEYDSVLEIDSSRQVITDFHA